jgi:hypothetical protein
MPQVFSPARAFNFSFLTVLENGHGFMAGRRHYTKVVKPTIPARLLAGLKAVFRPPICRPETVRRM